MINRMMKARLGMMFTAMIVSICMLVFSFIGGGIAYGAEQPAGTDDFDYNGYSAAQLKAISECIAGIPDKPCPSYSASTVDHYTGTVKHANMPTGVISTKTGWLQWADAAMKANSYDGVYGLVKLSSDNDPTHSVKDGSSTMFFRLVGINQDDRSDGIGKAGLTFQAAGAYSMPTYYSGSWTYYMINKDYKNAGGWRDSEFRKSMNSGIIWNVFPSDFKDNVADVSKITNNLANNSGYNGYTSFIFSRSSNATSATADKLWILSPSEMGMPGVRTSQSQSGAYVHVYVGDGVYDDTVKSTDDGNKFFNNWNTEYAQLYSNDSYQWWMLPAGDRKMSDGNQSYHNTDSYSYCAIANRTIPSLNTSCSFGGFWLRSPVADTNKEGYYYYFDGSHGDLDYNLYRLLYEPSVIPAFSF